MVRTCRVLSVMGAGALGAWGAPALGQELVFNGGFETGNFAGWNRPPNVGLGQPNPQYFNVVTAGGGHTSTFYAEMASTQLQYISTTLPLQTSAGQDYELTFWLRASGVLLGEAIIVRWEGVQVLNQQFGGIQPIPWTQFTVPLHANFTGSSLEFGQATFPMEYHIDDISVVQVPTPSVTPLFLIGGVAAMRRRRR